MATTPNRPIRLNNDNAEDIADQRLPPCIRKSRQEQRERERAQWREAMQASEDPEEEQAREERIAQFVNRFNNGLGEIEGNDEDEVVNL